MLLVLSFLKTENLVALRFKAKAVPMLYQSHENYLLKMVSVHCFSILRFGLCVKPLQTW